MRLRRVARRRCRGTHARVGYVVVAMERNPSTRRRLNLAIHSEMRWMDTNGALVVDAMEVHLTQVQGWRMDGCTWCDLSHRDDENGGIVSRKWIRFCPLHGCRTTVMDHLQHSKRSEEKGHGRSSRESRSTSIPTVCILRFIDPPSLGRRSVPFQRGNSTRRRHDWRTHVMLPPISQPTGSENMEGNKWTA